MQKKLCFLKRTVAYVNSNALEKNLNWHTCFEYGETTLSLILLPCMKCYYYSKSTLDMLDAMQSCGICLIDPEPAENLPCLSPRLKIVDIYLFSRYFNEECFQEIPKLVPREHWFVAHLFYLQHLTLSLSISERTTLNSVSPAKTSIHWNFLPGTVSPNEINVCACATFLQIGIYAVASSIINCERPYPIVTQIIILNNCFVQNYWQFVCPSNICFAYYIKYFNWLKKYTEYLLIKWKNSVLHG